MVSNLAGLADWGTRAIALPHASDFIPHANSLSRETLKSLRQDRDNAAVSDAARVAGEADMIWCSTHACKPVPVPVVEWLNEALKLKGEARTAFVALLQCPARSSVEKSAARASIASVARAPGVDFFLQRFDCDCRLRVEEQMRKSRSMHLFC